MQIIVVTQTYDYNPGASKHQNRKKLERKHLLIQQRGTVCTSAACNQEYSRTPVSTIIENGKKKKNHRWMHL